MALGDLLQMLAMPQDQGISTTSGYQPQAPVAQPQSQPVTQPVVTPASGGLMPDGPQSIAGHHINNLLQVTGNLAPPPGASTTTDQTQANIPGGYHTPDAVSDPTGGDPNYYTKHVNGPFKTHGVIGDILGHVMDAALVSAGLHPEYSQRAAAAKQADAIHGYQNDPTGAFQRLTAVSGVPAATAFQQGIDQDINVHNEQADKQARLILANNQANLAKQAALSKARIQQANLAGTLLNADPNDKNAQAKAKIIAQQIKAMRAPYGDDEEVPDTVEGLQDFANGSVPVDKRIVAQNTKDYHDAQLAEQHTRTGIMAANSGTQARNADTSAAREAREAASQPTLDASRKAQAAAARASAVKNLSSPNVTGTPTPRAAKAGAAPPVGYKNANGLTFQGGDPNVRGNWK